MLPPFLTVTSRALRRIPRHAVYYHKSAKEVTVTLDGQTLYIGQEVAEALGWKPGTSTEGVSLRLSGWRPHYFAITERATDADHLARGTIESSRNPRVQGVLEYLKKSDSS
ncbi:unnamed protein product [Cyclocybe aegerita]|uniref:Uncharacterized protein n=1 Tax=Cyclocybe aegerita TaxID=1973307 RepID=A0A8S0WS50_CYCAE|nr:unnamed protein product [Cyclocybe aegerita]